MKDEDVSTSKADQIYSWLLDEFNAGRILVGDRLPSENELSNLFSVSRPQVRLALARLVHEGLVGSVRGKGSFRLDVQSNTNRDIAVVLPRLNTYIYPELVVAAGEAIRRRGYQALFDCSNCRVETEVEILSRLLERRPAGLIMSPVQQERNIATESLALIQRLRSRGTAVVLIDNTLGAEDISSIVVDDYAAGRKAAEYLLCAGPNAAVCWRANHVPFHDRARGFLSVLGEYFPQQSVDKCRIWNTLCVEEGPVYLGCIAETLKDIKPDRSSLSEALEMVLRSSVRPGAVFCTDDDLAFALRDAAKTVGLQIPGALSIIGFDDSPPARLPEFSLTSFAYPSSILGSKAAELIIDGIETGPPHTRFSLVVEPVLMERDTVLLVDGL